MLFKIKTFLYSAVKHIVEDHGTEQYWIKHGIDVVLYFYWLIRVFLIGLMYIDSDKFSLFYENDYVSAYFWQHRNILNKFFVIIILMCILMGLLGLKTFFYERVDTFAFQLLHDCIVYNTEQYYKSLDTKENVAIKLTRRYNDYHQRFRRDHRILSSLKPIANLLVYIRYWLDSWFEMDRVNKKLFEKTKLRLFPHSTIKDRNYSFLFIIIFDAFNFITHIVIGKFVCFINY